MGNRDWDQYWLERAQLNATMSTCLRRSVGAVAVRHRRSFADAFNGNMPGKRHCVDGGCERCRLAGVASGVDLAHCVCVHAEANIVSFCARNGISLNGATIYCTTLCCGDCTKLLVVSGVVEVVYDEWYPVPEWVWESGLRIRRFHE